MKQTGAYPQNDVLRMRRQKPLALALGLLFLASVPVSAQFLDGNDLVSECERYPIDAGTYIIGVMDGAFSEAMRLNGAAPFCIPNGVTQKQLQQIVCSAFDASPSVWHQKAAGLVTMIAADTFPCQ